MARTAKYKHEIVSKLQSGADPLALTKEYPVTPSYVYKLAKQVRLAKKQAVAPAKPVSMTSPTLTKPASRLSLVHALNQKMTRSENFAAAPGRPPSPYSQLSVSSLKKIGGDIAEEYLRELQGSRGVQIYREMGNDAVVAATLSAMRMTLRRVSWYADENPAKEDSDSTENKSDTGKADLDFLESCMHDMSVSWSDYIDQSLSMLQYGFSVFEPVYKVRRGPNTNRPGPKTARSSYNDGKIGWKKMAFIGQDTLSPGKSWIFDNDGSLRGLNQQPPMGSTLASSMPITIPIEKLILFRTTVERDNPEGKSVLRPMWKPYYIKSQMEEVEAISAERMGSGFPVFYLGEDVAKADSDSTADVTEFQVMARNIRVDEQMGLVIPYAKMGQGMAREGAGVLFELVSPPARGGIDFSMIIQRYEKRMAMVGLAQFIHLGMDQNGTQALATVTTDFFQLAVSSWADALQDTINRFMVRPLLELNGMPLENHPIIRHGDISAPNLKDLGDYINKTVGAQVITPDDRLEETLRRVAGLPDKDPSTERSVMNEVNGDGGTRVSRNEKAKPANNQRNQNPTAAKPKIAEKPVAKKPMRADADLDTDDM